MLNHEQTVLFLFMLREPSRYKKLQESLDEALDGVRQQSLPPEGLVDALTD